MRRVSKLLFPTAMMLLLCGFGPCEQVALNNPPPTEDLLPPPTDMASHSDGGTGVAFIPDIQNDLNAIGCAVHGCHATFAPVFIANPTTLQQEMSNYAVFTSECTASDPAASPIIQNALGMDAHAGGTLISVGDPVYNRWVAWIGDGERLQ